ncbi:hypothetical protein HAZT_HAZT007327 [Hyalella azteca]|nr:hypothetical protein HAZT_HAZT007327 [Hyalella azteca]
MAEEDLESFDHEVLVEVEQQLQQQLLRGPLDAGEEEEVFLQQMLNEEEARETVFYPQHQMMVNQAQLDQMQRQFETMQLNRQQQQQMQQLQQQQQMQHLQQQQLLQMQQNGHCLSSTSASNHNFKLNPEAAVFVPREESSQDAPEAALTNGGASVATNGSSAAPDSHSDGGAASSSPQQ